MIQARTRYNMMLASHSDFQTCHFPSWCLVTPGPLCWFDCLLGFFLALFVLALRLRLSGARLFFLFLVLELILLFIPAAIRAHRLSLLAPSGWSVIIFAARNRILSDGRRLR